MSTNGILRNSPNSSTFVVNIIDADDSLKHNKSNFVNSYSYLSINFLMSLFTLRKVNNGCIPIGINPPIVIKYFKLI